MDDKLPAKTAKFTSLENLYIYGSGYPGYVVIGGFWEPYGHICIMAGLV